MPDDATGIPFEMSKVYRSGPRESRKDGPLDPPLKKVENLIDPDKTG